MCDRVTGRECPRVAKILRAIMYAGFINFGIFFVAALFLGGDAWNGTIRGGQHYLSENGRLTPVSAAVFHYSMIHAVSVLVTVPLAIICGIAYQIVREK